MLSIDQHSAEGRIEQILFVQAATEELQTESAVGYTVSLVLLGVWFGKGHFLVHFT